MLFESIRVTLLVLGVVSLAAAFLKISRYSPYLKRMSGKENLIKIVEKKKLSAKAELVFLKVCEWNVLLGVTDAHVTVIMKQNTDNNDKASCYSDNVGENLQ